METNLSNVYTVKGEYHLDYILCFFFFFTHDGFRGFAESSNLSKHVSKFSFVVCR